MTIYVVQIGSYSSTRIITCTTDEQKAIRLKKIYSRIDDDADVLVFEDGVIEDNYPMFEVWIRNGVCDYCEDDYLQNEEKCQFSDDVNGCHLFFVKAECAEVAQKIAQDKFAEWKARKENLI